MSLRHALLGLLADGPASGYDMLGTFRTSLANVWPATQSQMYTELTKLDAAGLVRVAEEGARGRKTYAITDPGRAELRTWLLETAPNGYRRNDVLLRVFLLGTVERDEARGFLRDRAESAAARLAELKSFDASMDWGDDDLSVYGRLTLEWGKRFMAMQAEWAEWAQRQVAGAEPRAGALD
ncbi:PadR family transcriptional regulator [Streptomyces sp. VRA16 Mangrove soil]|uniref:PadR family transcriptional regulator n=1 Tax=Streptomyces sp. VRA16 Mangrove soil TaxID=2817434 RepID=UPI001A9D6D5F|nr:PadR family transcriptional regulator [Streptomyces sp. VRA16 Mangrove soil]MBO1334678.1 PadR family transcriptional regulator [Streptomyces sp. VRA16 Mangrove soil]